MKTFIIIMLITCFINTAKSQQKASDQLKKTTAHFYTGTVIQTVGVVICAAAVPTVNPVIFVIGGLVYISGCILKLESYAHIEKAGEILKEKGL